MHCTNVQSHPSFHPAAQETKVRGPYDWGWAGGGQSPHCREFEALLVIRQASPEVRDGTAAHPFCRC